MSRIGCLSLLSSRRGIQSERRARVAHQTGGPPTLAAPIAQLWSTPPPPPVPRPHPSSPIQAPLSAYLQISRTPYIRCGELGRGSAWCRCQSPITSLVIDNVSHYSSPIIISRHIISYLSLTSISRQQLLRPFSRFSAFPTNTSPPRSLMRPGLFDIPLMPARTAK